MLKGLNPALSKVRGCRLYPKNKGMQLKVFSQEWHDQYWWLKTGLVECGYGEKGVKMGV